MENPSDPAQPTSARPAASDTQPTPELAKITLEEPIRRPAGDILEVRLRRPQPRELEGLNLRDLANCEASPNLRLLPLITEPQLVLHEVATMDIADFAQMCAEVSNFLLPKAYRVPTLS